MTGNLTEEQRARIHAKVDKLLSEGNFKEAAEIMVAVAIVEMDKEEFIKGLLAAIKEFKNSR